MRDIPLSVTDKTLSAIFSRFGALRAVTVDRSHGVRQRKWRERKESELRQSQQRELQRTIAKLRETFVDDLTTAYEQQFLRVSVGGGSDGDIETLRLMMAHLQYQFDLCDLLELDAASQSLLVPICSDSTVAAVLAPIAQCEGAEAMSLFQQRGRVIIANAPHTQKLRDALQTHPLVTSIRRTSVEKAELDAALRHGELEVTFRSPTETSMRRFISGVATEYLGVAASALRIDAFTPHRIPSFWRRWSERGGSDGGFFGDSVRDTEHALGSIAQRVTDREVNSDAKSEENLFCSALIHFDSADAVRRITASKALSLWGMVINGVRCSVSRAPTMLRLSNVPHSETAPLRICGSSEFRWSWVGRDRSRAIGSCWERTFV